MTAIKENKRKGRVISYRFTAYLGKDSDGKQIKKTTTWHPPSDMTPAKERKAAERAADQWEQSLKADDPDEPEATQTAAPLSPVPVQPSRSDDFVSFMNDVWFPLAIEGSDRKPKTVYAYKTYLIIESAYFKGKTIQEITSIDIQQFLRYLRKEYHGQYGIGLKPKTVHHHYNLLNLIFAYAQEQEIITTNPMARVKSPKKERHPVEAFTKEQAKQFIELLDGAEFEFKCMMLILLTTGIRRGELCGLQWGDIDFEAKTISINRSVSYTPDAGRVIEKEKRGVIAAAPVD